MRYAVILAVCCYWTGSLHAQDDTLRRLADAEARLTKVEERARNAEDRASRAGREASDAAPYGFVTFLYGVFCALGPEHPPQRVELVLPRPILQRHHGPVPSQQECRGLEEGRDGLASRMQRPEVQPPDCAFGPLWVRRSGAAASVVGGRVAGGGTGRVGGVLAEPGSV